MINDYHYLTLGVSMNLILLFITQLCSLLHLNNSRIHQNIIIIINFTINVIEASKYSYDHDYLLIDGEYLLFYYC